MSKVIEQMRPGVMDFGEFVRSQGLPDDLIGPLCEELLNREKAQHHAELARREALLNMRPDERIPLLDGREEFGRVEARIPAASFFYWGKRPDVGFEAWEDDTFIDEYLRDNPMSRVKTVQPNGRIVVGYTGTVKKTVKKYGQ